MRPLAMDGAGKDAFRLKPDVVLMERTQVRFILDEKWKRLDLDHSARTQHGGQRRLSGSTTGAWRSPGQC